MSHWDYRDATGMRVLRPADTTYVSGLQAWIDAIPAADRGLLVEIGSYRGESAVMFAPHFREVICIDPWVDLEREHADFVARTAGFVNVSARRQLSIEAAKEFVDVSVDVVYIDANHQWRGVVSDILAWRPKVRPGGWIGGHDYSEPCAVVKAVDHYFPGAQIFEDTSWLAQI